MFNGILKRESAAGWNLFAAQRMFWMLLAGLVLLAQTATAMQIGAVVVENIGVIPIEEDSVRILLEARPGRTFSQTLVNRDVKSLQKSGIFSMVEVGVEASGDGEVTLIYHVEKRPVTARIVVSGAEHMGNDRVRELLDLELGDPVDDDVVGSKISAIKAEYRKDYFIEPRLDWTIERDGRPGQAFLRLTVDEGERMKIGAIRFSGNRFFSDKELRKLMELNQFQWYNPWHWVSGAGRLEPGTLLQDRERLAAEYRNTGFLDVEIGKPAIEKISKKRLALVIPVSEGVRYRVGSTALEGVELFPLEDVAAEITLERGEWASQQRIDRDARMIQEYFGSRGYIETRTYPRLFASEDEVVDIVFNVEEGSLAHIRDVVIRGNRITRDEVIRRELVTLPGQKYNEKKVRTSEQRLRNLGYFQRVASYNDETDRSGLYDLVYEVDETQMGRMSVGASFSSIDKLVGFFEISHGNFDMNDWPPVGDGQKINLRAEIGSERRDVSLSFTEPWFLDRRLALGFDIYSRESQYLSGDYDQKNLGGSVSLTQPLGGFKRLRTAYSIENYDIYNVDDDAGQRIKEEEGKWLKSSVSASVSRDTRDNYLLATRGSRTRLSASLSGGYLQGDIDIYSLQLSSSQHWNIWKDHVVSFRERIGVVDHYGDSDRVPIFDRFFLGGPFSMRGFDYRDVGPVDEDDEPLGGNSMAYASAEYAIPIVDPIRFATFYDVGMVWREAWKYDGSINSDYGLGIRFDIPMFPIRLDYAWPLQADEHNDRDSGRFGFAIGQFF